MTSLIADTWLLLTLRWQVAWNGFRSQRLARKVILGLLTLWVGLVVGGLSVSAGLGAGALLRRLPQWHLEGILPGLILTAITLILLISSFGVALSSLFLSDDLDLLMSAPVDRRAVFVSKILDGLGWYYALVTATAVPALVAYGLALGYGPLYYFLAVVAGLGAPLLPASVGAVLVMFVARFAPARRVREVLGVLVILVSTGLSLLGQLGRAWTQPFRQAEANPQGVLTALQTLAALPLPPLVAGRGLAAAGVGDWAMAVSQLTGFLLLTFGVFAGCIWLADAMYTTGWARLRGSGSARRDRRRAEREAAHAGWLGRAPTALAIAFKDWWMITRDVRQFAQLLTPLILLPVGYFNVLTRNGRQGIDAVGTAGPIDARSLLVAGGILTATVLIFGRVAVTSISREGGSWWLLKSAPLSGLQLLSSKVAAAAIPFALLTTALMTVAALWLRLNPASAFYSWFAVELLGAGMLVICVALGVPWARLDWDDPRRMSSGWGELVAFAACVLLAAIAGGLLSLPLVVASFWPSLTVTAWVFGPAAATAVVAGVAGVAMSLGSSLLANVGEA